MVPDLKRAWRRFSICKKTASSSIFTEFVIIKVRKFPRCTRSMSTGPISGRIFSRGWPRWSRQPHPGRFEDGLSALTEALVAADEDDNRFCEAETHRLKGELLLKQNGSSNAEAQRWFERAIEVARKQSAKSWELRATMNLARLLER